MAVLLKQWSRDSFGSVRREIKKLQSHLSTLNSSSTTTDHLQEGRYIEQKLCELFEREEIMARQRSRVDWLREGDRNTAFFHARASTRRRSNKINCLIKKDGTRCEDKKEIKTMARDFYMNLFLSEPNVNVEVILDAISTKVDQSTNEELCKPYTDEEIKEALFQMGPTKAPGPDGFPALFYQRHWDLLQKEICQAVRSFLMGGLIPEGLCDTTIVLIPKVSKPEHLANFRPVSLCNVIYKIASKVLANRLKSFLSEIVSEEQSAFVPGRLITDNVLIAYECLHTIKRQQSKKPFFALKIDMLKAYDRVEWDYLRRVLQKLGFHESWISSVMRCVSSVRYAIRINGELTETFYPTRGLRQGDPISPYLFLLCAEGLSCLLKKKEKEGSLKGIRNGITGPPVSHLLFADESIFFTRGDVKSVSTLKSVLQHYSEGSGQRVNLQKSSIFFGNRCPRAIKERVMNELNIYNEALQSKYLGMPTCIKKINNEHI
jgi:hypothetical protein